MNDDFLRRLRPVPRAAFVHELKGRLERQARAGSMVSGPVYLRTLLIALLIGGAAFAVTLLTTRHESLVTRVNLPAPQAPRPADHAPKVAFPAAAETKRREVSPAIAREAARNPASQAEAASGSREQPGAEERAASSAPAAALEPPSPVIAGLVLSRGAVRVIEGAGGSFAAPLFAAWSQQYRQVGGVPVSYHNVGSGGGLKLLLSRAVAFAVLDAPMSAIDLSSSGLFQLPVAAGGVVPIVRLDGVETARLALDASTMARIYLGEISRWNDMSIAQLNPGITLPDTRITLAYRLDDSASTSLFTYYLSQGEGKFRRRYGTSSQIDVSPGAATRGEDGMADFVQRTNGAIGYVDYIYAHERRVPSIRLINREGALVLATPESLESAVTHAAWEATAGPGSVASRFAR